VCPSRREDTEHRLGRSDGTGATGAACNGKHVKPIDVWLRNRMQRCWIKGAAHLRQRIPPLSGLGITSGQEIHASPERIKIDQQGWALRGSRGRERRGDDRGADPTAATDDPDG
jgi:hypothetical protein